MPSQMQLKFIIFIILIEEHNIIRRHVFLIPTLTKTKITFQESYTLSKSRDPGNHQSSIIFWKNGNFSYTATKTPELARAKTLALCLKYQNVMQSRRSGVTAPGILNFSK